MKRFLIVVGLFSCVTVFSSEGETNFQKVMSSLLIKAEVREFLPARDRARLSMVSRCFDFSYRRDDRISCALRASVPTVFEAGGKMPTEFGFLPQGRKFTVSNIGSSRKYGFYRAGCQCGLYNFATQNHRVMSNDPNVLSGKKIVDLIELKDGRIAALTCCIDHSGCTCDYYILLFGVEGLEQKSSKLLRLGILDNIIELDDGRIAFCCDFKMKTWNPIDGVIEILFQGEGPLNITYDWLTKLKSGRVAHSILQRSHSRERSVVISDGNLKPITVLKKLDKDVFFPDRAVELQESRLAVVGKVGDGVEIWNLETRELERVLGRDFSVKDLVELKDRKIAVSLDSSFYDSRDTFIGVYDLSTGACDVRLSCSGRASDSLVLLKDGNLFASYDGRSKVWDPYKGLCYVEYSHREDGAETYFQRESSDDGRALVVFRKGNRTIKMKKMATPGYFLRKLEETSGLSEPCRRAAFASDGAGVYDALFPKSRQELMIRNIGAITDFIKMRHCLRRVLDENFDLSGEAAGWSFLGGGSETYQLRPKGPNHLAGLLASSLEKWKEWKSWRRSVNAMGICKEVSGWIRLLNDSNKSSKRKK